VSSSSRILLAEDNAADVFLVRKALKKEDLDYQLEVFSDGEEVLRFLEMVEKEAAPCPALMLLDLNLPKRSGEEILESFRGTARCSSIPVIVLTSSDSPKDRERAASFGVAHYFRKPADLNEFMMLGPVIRKVLRITET
jgi:CheY-like chemotaxis protein